MKVYEVTVVTVHWTAVRYVVAGDSMEAERIAEEDVTSFDVEHDHCESCEVTKIERVPEYDRDEPPLSHDGESEWTIAEWLAHPANPGGAVREAIEAWRAARPATVGDLPAWLAREPRAGRRWCAPLANGGAMVTNGHAMIAVDSSSPTEPFVTMGDLPLSFREPELASAAVAKIVVDPKTKPIEVARLREWLGQSVTDESGGDGAVRVLNCGGAILNADYVAAWLLPVLDVSGATTIEAGTCHAGAALFRGDGWSAVIMPRRSEAQTADLLEAAA